MEGLCCVPAPQNFPQMSTSPCKTPKSRPSARRCFFLLPLCFCFGFAFMVEGLLSIQPWAAWRKFIKQNNFVLIVILRSVSALPQRLLFLHQNRTSKGFVKKGFSTRGESLPTELNGHHPLPAVLAQGSSPPNAILESECIQNQTDPRVK